MSRLTWFEIHAAEPARAMRFYGGLFGWTFDSFGDDYWLIHTGDPAKAGIDGGLLPRRGPSPAEGQPVNACARDTEGNLFGIVTMDERAS